MITVQGQMECPSPLIRITSVYLKGCYDIGDYTHQDRKLNTSEIVKKNEIIKNRLKKIGFFNQNKLEGTKKASRGSRRHEEVLILSITLFLERSQLPPFIWHYLIITII
jgi:hypothetical protein